MVASLKRFLKAKDRTYGVMYYNNKPLCVTLELPWLDNENDISCIPSGFYKCKLDVSPSKNPQLDGKVFKVLNVADRSNILIHIGNYTKDTLGCILVGSGFGDDMITGSKIAMEKLLNTLPEEFMLEIS